jgi:hypothetical protein
MEGSSPEVILEGEPSVEAARETPTGQSRLAYQLAALFLLINVVVGLPGQVVIETFTGLGNFALFLPIPLALAIGLLEFRSGARVLTIVFAVLAFLVSILGLTVVELLVAWTGPVAFLLLLTGQSKRWRIIIAVALYVVGLLNTIWGLLRVTGIGVYANSTALLPLAAVILISAAILVRYLSQEGQLRRWAVLILTLSALVMWIGGYLVSDASLVSATLSILAGAVIGVVLNLQNDKTRLNVVIALIALMALVALLALCRLSGFPGGV